MTIEKLRNWVDFHQQKDRAWSFLGTHKPSPSLLPSVLPYQTRIKRPGRLVLLSPRSVFWYTAREYRDWQDGHKMTNSDWLALSCCFYDIKFWSSEGFHLFFGSREGFYLSQGNSILLLFFFFLITVLLSHLRQDPF